MTTYKIKLNIEGGNSLELDLDKEHFEKMSAFLDHVLPDKEWKTVTTTRKRKKPHV